MYMCVYAEPEYTEVEKMERQEQAATKIQSCARGYLARKRVRQMKAGTSGSSVQPQAVVSDDTVATSTRAPIEQENNKDNKNTNGTPHVFSACNSYAPRHTVHHRRVHGQSMVR
jgi:hypothetical protein